MSWKEYVSHKEAMHVDLIERLREDPDAMISVFERWMLLHLERGLPDDVLVICHLRGLLDERV